MLQKKLVRGKRRLAIALATLESEEAAEVARAGWLRGVREMHQAEATHSSTSR